MEVQAEFRDNYSTIDQVFILHSLIRKHIKKKGDELFVAFLDLRGAFDGVGKKLLILLEIACREHL